MDLSKTSQIQILFMHLKLFVFQKIENPITYIIICSDKAIKKKIL